MAVICRQKGPFVSVGYFFVHSVLDCASLKKKRKKRQPIHGECETQHRLKHLTTYLIKLVLAGLVIWHLMTRLLISSHVSAKLV